MSTKKEIRKSIIEKRDKLSVSEKNSFDEKIFNKVNTTRTRETSFFAVTKTTP